MPATATKKVLIVGAGPVGSLTALTFHKRGWQVEIWEGREDPRGTDMTPANLRSINLAISSRGLEALRSVDPSLADELLGQAIPMKGRMIHHNDGRQESQLYDPAGGQCINSLPRPLLNLRLIQALPTDSDRMKLRFETKLDRIDWRRNIAYARPKKGGKPGEELAQGTNHEEKEGDQDSDSVEFDLVIGCDGSWSKVRQEMMKVERIDFSQSFIQHAYIELHMPPNEVKENNDNDAKFKIDQHHLHIWPRHSFMLIGLPNQDGSFTLTLFAPFTSIEHLNTTQQAEEFFKEHFPTALEWVGKDKLIEDFMKNPRGKLVTINASPSHHDSKALLLGDSSHSMVPFYGQGLNCGLEDVRVLGCMLEKHNVSSVKSSGGSENDAALGQALSEYSEIRGKDLEAICELAMENYTEMRSHVLTPMHHLRRIIDSCLSRLFRPTPYTPLSTPSSSSLSKNTVAFPTPHVSGWSSLYSMVTFRPDVSYREALRKERAQREVVAWMGRGLVGAALAGVGLAGYKAAHWWSTRR